MFTPLGLFGGVESRSLDVSADGSAVVGQSTSGAFHWTAAGSMVQPANAAAVSANGRVVVGFKSSILGFEAFRWTVDGTFDLLGDLPGGSMNSAAFDVSADGSKIVGHGTPSFPNEAFPVSWTGTIISQLGGLERGSALGISEDGNVIVGHAGSPLQAFRRVGSSVTQLGFLPGATSSTARRVSADGSFIVGQSSHPLPVGSTDLRAEAFRWTEASGMVSLGDLPGGRIISNANDVSADGSVIVGSGETSFENGVSISEAFYWTSATGMLNLRNVLISAGATGLDGWTLSEARGVSWDGFTVVGSGINPSGAIEAFVATVPEPSTIMLGIIAALGLLAFYVLRFWRYPASRKH
jgi:uncharacterized membrane protein